VPFKAYDLPSVHGVIRDTRTHEPITGAQILVKSKRDADMYAEAVSDRFGHFDTAESIHTVWLPPLPFDMAMPDCIIHISAHGYGDQQFDLYGTLKAQFGKVGGIGPIFELTPD
jgi:hypothetical protein